MAQRRDDFTAVVATASEQRHLMLCMKNTADTRSYFRRSQMFLLLDLRANTHNTQSVRTRRSARRNGLGIAGRRVLIQERSLEDD